MPAPPGEVGRNAMVVNTEVDYRDEDDLTQTDIGHGAGGSSNGTKGQSTVRAFRSLLRYVTDQP